MLKKLNCYNVLEDVKLSSGLHVEEKQRRMQFLTHFKGFLCFYQIIVYCLVSSLAYCVSFLLMFSFCCISKKSHYLIVFGECCIRLMTSWALLTLLFFYYLDYMHGLLVKIKKKNIYIILSMFFPLPDPKSSCNPSDLSSLLREGSVPEKYADMKSVISPLMKCWLDLYNCRQCKAQCSSHILLLTPTGGRQNSINTWRNWITMEPLLH